MARTTIWTPKRDGDREHDPIRGIDYVWRPEVGRKYLSWMAANLHHVKGPREIVGKKLRFDGWQAEYLSALYGWRVYKHEHLRRYRRALLEVARGNGKTTLAAGVGLKGLFGPNIGSPLVIGAATDRESAGIVFADAASMVRASRALSAELKVIDSTKRILRRSQKLSGFGGQFLILSSEAHRAHGYHPNVVIFDELHAQPNRDLWDVLTTSQINLTDALMLAITTAGFDRHSICWEVHKQALLACDNRDVAPDLLAAIFAADDGDDIEDPKVWLKANPNLGVSVVPENLRAEVVKAKRDPAYMNTVMRLHMNIWTQSDVRWMPMREWDACGGIVDEEKLKGRPCFAGLDLAQVSDLTALALVFPPDNDKDDDGVYDVLMRFWAPEETIAQNPLYQDFFRRGLLNATPGKATDFAFIREEIFKLASRYRIQELAYDRFYAAQLSQELEQEGIQVVPFGQGFRDMSAPTKELMRLVLDRRIRHGGNACLRWNADNLVVQQDPAGNVKPNKEKSGSKIDGVTALVMAVGRATADVGVPGIVTIGA